MGVRSFIVELQNSNSGRKIRWLIGLTLVTVAALFGLWILLSPGPSPFSGDLVRKEDQPTFFQKVALGTKEVVETLRTKTANTINFFSNKFKKTNTIEVKVIDDERQTTDDTNQN